MGCRADDVYAGNTYYSAFHYDTSGGVDAHSLINIDGDLLDVRGVLLDEAINACAFTAADQVDPMTAKREEDPAAVQAGTLEHIWAELQDLLESHPQDSEAYLNAFSLILTAGLSSRSSAKAEAQFPHRRANFAAYWHLTPSQRYSSSLS